MTNRRGLALQACAAFLALVGSAHAATYSLPAKVLSNGGGSDASANYALGSTTGQSSAVGPSGSATYKSYGGFWYTFKKLDTTPPETTILSGPAASTSSTTANFTFSSDEPMSTFECRLEAGGLWTQCNSGSSTYAGLALGPHTFSVRATDQAGNTDPTPAAHAWTVTPPTAPPAVPAPSSPAMRAAGAEISWAAVDGANSYRVWRSVDGVNYVLVGSVSAPGHAFVDTGTTANTIYWWSVSSLNSFGESSLSAPVTGRTALSYGWNMVSAPLDTRLTPSPLVYRHYDTVYGDWARFILEWVSTGNTDPEKSGSWVSDPPIVPGNGQLVWSDTDTVIDASLPGNPAAVTVTLVPGWNMIGSHLPQGLAGIGASWTVDGTAVPPGQLLSSAIAANLIHGTIYWWDGRNYTSWIVSTDNPTIEPWKGYWILNQDSVDHTLTMR